MLLADLGARDGWVCWLCGGEVDPRSPPGSPSAPSIDHVVPRARGGGNEAANVRLAHRRCNTRRGSRLPELEWPERLGVLDAAPLWQSLQRLARRPGTAELVALLPTRATADDASTWVTERAGLILGGEWDGRTEPVGATATELHGLWLSCRRARPPTLRRR